MLLIWPTIARLAMHSFICGFRQSLLRRNFSCGMSPRPENRFSVLEGGVAAASMWEDTALCGMFLVNKKSWATA